MAFITLPVLAVAFANNSDEIKIKITDLGFSPRASGRYKYYSGPATNSNVHTLIGFGAQPDAYSPYGMVNIRGFAAFNIISRILHASLGYLSQNVDDIFSDLGIKGEFDVSESWSRYAITSADQINFSGILFPYFDGLVLPDKSFTSNFIIARFANCLGNNIKEIRENSSLLASGWSSLSSTPAGLQLSHIAFGVSLALEGRQRVRPVVINDQYRGFILIGKKFGVMKGTMMNGLSTPDNLKEEFASLDEHNTAIVQLATLLSGIPSIREDKTVVVHPSALSSARAVHYLLVDRNLDGNALTTVNSCLIKLHFSQQYWSLHDKSRIIQVLTACQAGVPLPADTPFYLVPQFAATKDVILSNLAAFGAKSVSLLGVGSNVSAHLTASGKTYENIPSVKLEGVPVFYKPTVQAMEDFKDLMKSGTVSFKAGAKDKKGYSRIGNIGTFIGFDSNEYGPLKALLGSIAPRAGSKRAAAPKEPDSSKRVKRDVDKGEELLGIFGGPVVVPGDVGDEDMQEDEGF